MFNLPLPKWYGLLMVDYLTSAVDEKIWKVESALSEAVKMGYISPKLYELLQIFQSFG